MKWLTGFRNHLKNSIKIVSRTHRKRTGTIDITGFPFFCVETVGVEDDSQAETRSRRGLQDFISVGEHLGEHFYISKY